jgi:hypothetical protein
LYLPRSTRTIWQVLKDGGRIPTHVREHHPIQRPEPMQHWELEIQDLIGKSMSFQAYLKYMLEQARTLKSD